jgi:hypothetical protein
MPSRLTQAYLLVVVFLLSAALCVYLFYTPPGLSSGPAFVAKYAGFVLMETVGVAVLLLLLVPPLSGRLAQRLERGVALGRLSRAVAALALVLGLVLFTFWAAVDFLSGYSEFPFFAFQNYPITRTIYDAMGLGLVPFPDKDRVIGIAAFAVATSAFASLRLGRGLGVALRDALLYFALPIVIAFELALWYFVPAEMYWHFASFVPWSLGNYLDVNQYYVVYHEGPRFVWGGNIYLVSNWFVLFAACSIFALGLARTLRARASKAF